MRALILDMDGTMIDSEREIMDAMAQAGLEAGFAFDREIMESTVGVTHEETVNIMRRAYPDAPYGPIEARCMELYRERLRGGQVGIRPGLHSVLEAARVCGLPVAVCSSSHREDVETVLDIYHLRSYISAAVCSGEAGQAKPHPAPYLRAASLLGVTPRDCLAVEDSPHGALSALSAGMRVVVVPYIAPIPADIRARVELCEDLTGVCAYLSLE